MLISMKEYTADKNRLPTRMCTTSSVTVTDNDSLQHNPCLWAAMHSCLQTVHVYMHVWVLHFHPVVQYDWWLLLQRVLWLHHSIGLLLALCQLVLCCRQVIPSMPENPQFFLMLPTKQKNADPRHPGQVEVFPKQIKHTLLIFFILNLSLLHPAALCQIVSLTKKVKLVLFIEWAL